MATTLSPKSLNNFHFVVLVLYFLSGLASLAYEILWVRMLSLEFGVSIFGVVVTVAVFMLGLGLGSLWGLRILTKTQRPLLLFALLELAIAIFSISIPHIFQWLVQLVSAQAGDTLFGWYFWQLCFTGFILLVPALMMGIGFPVILNVCNKLKTSLALIYATNTLGAALGALLPLILLPLLGWEDSLYSVAGISLFIAIVAGLVSVRHRQENDPTSEEVFPAMDSKMLRNLLAYAGIGAVALMLEIGWTRLFGMLFLRTEYVLAIILAVFLVGTAIGSYLSHYLFRDRWFSILPVAAALLVVVGLWILPSVSALVNTQQMTSFNRVLVAQSSIVVLLTLPVTIIFGAWLPLLNQRLGYSGTGGARLYGANSVGAATGTLVTGFILLPVIGTYASIVLAAVLVIVFSMVWIEQRKAIISIVVVCLAAIPILKMVPVHELLPHRHGDTRDLYFHEDALNITHVIEQKDGQRILLADLQRMDASSDPESVHSQRNQGRLPLLLHTNPETVLFLGVGTGISMSASLGYKGLERNAVELSFGAIEATEKYFSRVNHEVASATRIIRDDAKRFLKSHSATYDVIVGDLFHPDLVGRSALLSRQQFLRVKSHLNQQGIFVQWLALNQFDPESLDIVLRTFKRVFPDAVLFLDAFRLALVGTNGKLADVSSLEAKFRQLNARERDLALGGETLYTWLGRYWGKINVGESGEIQDEWNPKIEFRLPQARYNGNLDLAVILYNLLKQRPHVSEAIQQLNINNDKKESFERAYIGTEFAHRSWLALLQKKNSEGHRLLKLAFQASPDDRWISMAVADATLENYDLTRPDEVSEEKLLKSILGIRPDHPEALKRLWMFYSNRGDENKARDYKNRLKQLSPYDVSLISERL